MSHVETTVADFVSFMEEEHSYAFEHMSSSGGFFGSVFNSNVFADEGVTDESVIYFSFDVTTEDYGTDEVRGVFEASVYAINSEGVYTILAFMSGETAVDFAQSWANR